MDPASWPSTYIWKPLPPSGRVESVTMCQRPSLTLTAFWESAEALFARLLTCHTNGEVTCLPLL